MLGLAFINAATVVLFFLAMAESVSPLLIVDEDDGDGAGLITAGAAFGLVGDGAGLITAGAAFGLVGDGAGFEPE